MICILLLGRKYKALEYYLRTLRVEEAKHGHDHISCVPAINNAAIMFSKMGRQQEELDFWLRSMTITEATNGKGSITSASAIAALGSIFAKQRKLKLGLEWCLRSLRIEEYSLGAENVSNTANLDTIGKIYEQQRKHRLALAYYLRSLQITERVHGALRLPCASAYRNIALLYQDSLEEYPEAVAYFEKAAQATAAGLGEEHVKTQQAWELHAACMEIVMLQERWRAGAFVRVRNNGEADWKVGRVECVIKTGPLVRLVGKRQAFHYDYIKENNR